MQSLEIAKLGNIVQSERLKVVAENLANEGSTTFNSATDPYRRKILIVKNSFHKKSKVNAPIIASRKYSKAPFRFKYEPMHPAADINGMVKLPNVYREVERVDSIEAEQSYQANIAMMEITKNMIQQTLDLLK